MPGQEGVVLAETHTSAVGRSDLSSVLRLSVTVSSDSCIEFVCDPDSGNCIQTTRPSRLPALILNTLPLRLFLILCCVCLSVRLREPTGQLELGGTSSPGFQRRPSYSLPLELRASRPARAAAGWLAPSLAVLCCVSVCACSLSSPRPSFSPPTPSVPFFVCPCAN